MWDKIMHGNIDQVRGLEDGLEHLLRMQVAAHCRIKVCRGIEHLVLKGIGGRTWRAISDQTEEVI